MSCLALAAALFVAPLAFPGTSMAEIRSGLDPAVVRRNLASVVPEEMARRRLVGAVVAVVDREGVILAEGYGLSDLERQTLVRPEYTTFRAASVSKLLTTATVMQLVERGSIDLDRELAAYIRGLELPRRDGRPITPRHLLTHSAGLSEGFIGSQARTRAEWLSLRDYLGRGLPAQFSPAGEIISYANYDIGLAGLLVESVSGLQFHEVVSREILQPLGMGHSSFGMEPAVLDGIAQGYVFVSGSQRRIPVDFRNNRASGGLVTSGLDMARFLRVFLSGGEVDGTRILRPETTTAMLTRQFSQHPGMKGIGFGFWELEIDGRSYWGHDGDVVGWNARALLMPDRGLGLFMAYTGTDTLKAFGDRGASTVFGPSHSPSSRERLARAVIAGADRLAGLYRWTRTARATPDRLFTPYWLVQYRARVDSSGELELSSALDLFPTSHWKPVGADLFQEVGGARRLSFPPAMGLNMFASDLLPLPEAIVPHGIPPFVYGVPPSAQLLLALPLAALAIAAVLVVRTLLARGARRGSLGLGAFVLLQAGFAAFLHYWNLLGYHF